MPDTSADQPLIVEIADGVATLTLNRPALHNAMDDVQIARLTKAVTELSADPAVRVLVITGAGQSFSAGGDLNWMRRMADYSEAENLADARLLADLMRALDRCPKPTIARVQGSAYAGGLGLVACCDVAIAVDTAEFAVTEVRIGLIPAVIAPYLLRAMSTRQARRWFLNAGRFSASEALAMGLIHAAVPAADLDAAVAREVKALLAASPAALAAAKDLIAAIDNRPIQDDVIDETARRIARQRASAEGKEGVSSFLEKRKPSWAASGGKPS